MSNINGKAYAMSVITPMPWWKTPIARLVLWFLGHLSSLEDLERLSFIHFARWVIIPRRLFPHLGQGQPVERLRYDYMLFLSNFNGTWNQYIDAFSDAIPAGLDAIWRWSLHYPGAVPVTPFKRYIAHNQVFTDHYYDAYPRATTTDVKSALSVQEKTFAFAEKAAGIPPGEFEGAFREFFASVSGDLGTDGEAPEGT